MKHKSRRGKKKADYVNWDTGVSGMVHNKFKILSVIEVGFWDGPRIVKCDLT